MKFIKNNKLLVILLSVALVMLLTILIVIFSNLKSGNNEYGNRLDNIEKYPISDEIITKIQTEISALDKVDSVTYNLEGRLINFVINVEDDLPLVDAQVYASKILEYFDEETKKYYDIQILIDSKSEESTIYPIIGYKHKTSNMLVWKQ